MVQAFWKEGGRPGPYLVSGNLANLAKNTNFNYALTQDGSLVRFERTQQKKCQLLEGLYILS